MAVALLVSTAMLCGAAWAQEAPPPPKTHGPALFTEPGFMTSALDFAAGLAGRDSGNGKNGFYPKFGKMVTGAGWISVGPGYRTRLLNGRAVIDTYAQISWRGYTNADASLEFPLLAGGRLTVGSEALWQDAKQVNYFGLGAASDPTLRSHYRLQSLNVVGYAKYRPRRSLAIGGRFGWLDGPSVGSATGPFSRDYLDTQATFPNDPAMTVPRQPQFLHGEVSATADTRDAPGHPTSGAVYRAAVGVYSDRDLDAYSFRRYEVEGAQFVPLFDEAWIIAVRGWGVFSDTPPGNAVPFYLTPGLGGANTIRGYSDYRFHDRHLLLASAESRWPLFQHIDAAVFVDTGTVAARVRDLGFDRTAYGLGFRVHSHQATTARVDVARGTEGWQFVFRLNDSFSLSRLARWTAAVPFVP
jgi:hypothetical protein